MKLNEHITLIIKAFERKSSLIKLITSIRNYYPIISIVIVDDSKAPLLQKSELDKNITYIKTDFDIGLSKGRNTALEYVQTDYFVLLDDDFLFTEKTKLETLLKFIQQHDLDIVGGQILDNGKNHDPYEGSLFQLNRSIYHLSCFTKRKGNVLYYNVIRNFFIASTKRVQALKWDDKLKMGEHENFFLRAKKKKFKISLCQEVSIDHYPVTNQNYKKYRKRAKEFQRKALQDLNIKQYYKVIIDGNRIQKFLSRHSKICFILFGKKYLDTSVD